MQLLADGYFDAAVFGATFLGFVGGNGILVAATDGTDAAAVDAFAHQHGFDIIGATL